MGGMLLTHLSASSASKHGVTIHGEGVIENQHTFYLIAEAENKEKMEEFLQPFAQAGTVEVWPANHCEAVVQRAGC